MYVCMYSLPVATPLKKKILFLWPPLMDNTCSREVRGLMSSFLFPGQNIEKPDLVQVLLPLGHDCSGHVIYRK